ncbi:MAG: YceI family protein [Hyphomicrobiaceae bacterium]
MLRTAKKALAAIVFVAFTSAQAWAATETYYTDQGHTEVRFGWTHAGISKQTGEFLKATGKLVLDPDNVERSTLSVTIDMNSLSTGYGPLDKHLKSKDFLEVETYPEMKFVSTAVKSTGDKTADVTGNMTIHGVTKPVTLKTTLTHRGKHPLGTRLPYYKGNWVAFSATTTIDHQAFKVGGFSTGPITVWIVTEMKDREK